MILYGGNFGNQPFIGLYNANTEHQRPLIFDIVKVRSAVSEITSMSNVSSVAFNQND